MEELKTSDYLKGIVLNLPESPGVYQYLNTEGTIIYVGKAKNLKRRVSSYFNREHEPGKTRVLVSKIADIRYIVVNTEEDALLLENNLIKKYKPRYNVLLKDDKTYPSICVQNEYFPRVFKTRRVIRNGSSYYGPYSHIPSMYALLDLIKHLYPLRTCNLNLSPENIRAGKFNVCLEYHIKNCAGPCVGKQSQEEYLNNIAEIKEILKGNTQEVGRMLYRQMQDLAAEMKFEEAQKIKEKYLLLENYRSKSEVVSNILHNIDVFSIEEDTDEKSAFINYLHITNGAINQAFTFEYKKRLNETKEELLSLGIIEMRERYKSLSREIIVPFELDMELKDVVFTIPQRGDKKKLLELSILNVKQYKADRQVIQPPLLALDRQQVGKCLRRMAVAAVPGIDDRDTGILRTDQRRPLLEMAHGDDVGEATNHPYRIGDRFALRHRRRSGVRKADDAAAELQHGRSETQPRAGRRLVEERRKFFALADFAVFGPVGDDVLRQGDDLPDLGDRQIRRVD